MTRSVYFCYKCCANFTRNFLCFFSVISVSLTGTANDAEFTLLLGDEVTDFSLLFEKMLASNDENFPVIMEFLRINNLMPEIADVHRDIGYTFINSSCNVCDLPTKWTLAQNLKYLKENGCDLNLEMFNYLRSLTFGGSLVKRGENFLKVIQLLLPLCTDFFHDVNLWKKIRYFSADTKEIKAALDFLITNYGCEKNYKFLPPQQSYTPFSLKHLARNKVREDVWNNKKTNLSVFTFCKENLPVTLFKYVIFLD